MERRVRVSGMQVEGVRVLKVFVSSAMRRSGCGGLVMVGDVGDVGAGGLGVGESRFVQSILSEGDVALVMGVVSLVKALGVSTSTSSSVMPFAWATSVRAVRTKSWLTSVSASRMNAGLRGFMLMTVSRTWSTIRLSPIGWAAGSMQT